MFEPKPVVHVVGCGNFGSMLAFELVKNRLVNKISIYDKDIASGNGETLLKSFAPLKKVVAIRYLLEKINNDVEIFSFDKLVSYIETANDEMIFDCRDKKYPPLFNSIKLTSDGSYCYIDTREMKSKESVQHEVYVLPKSLLNTSLSVSLFLRFLSSGKIDHDKIYVIDLNTTELKEIK